MRGKSRRAFGCLRTIHHSTTSAASATRKMLNATITDRVSIPLPAKARRGNRRHFGSSLPQRLSAIGRAPGPRHRPDSGADANDHRAGHTLPHAERLNQAQGGRRALPHIAESEATLFETTVFRTYPTAIPTSTSMAVISAQPRSLVTLNGNRNGKSAHGSATPRIPLRSRGLNGGSN